jgi:light-regulated signal transduction histidine kinase (bacteriophytochrome)
MTREELLEAELAKEKAARKRAEDLLEQKTLELTREISDHEKSAQRLQQQAEALARSNQELEQFAYAASHDLQAPLRSITGFSQLLMKHAGPTLDQKNFEFVEYIESSARHLHLLINDLLEYSRVGRAEQRFEWVDAGDVVRQATRQVGEEVEKSHAAVLHANLPKVHADAKQLVLLFQHLLSNAMKYSREGIAPVIRITGEEREGGWEFAVRDNGIGIDPNETGRIFIIFQRLHSLDKYEGTGIGLSICKKIVERHGGRIWAEGQPGEGSTFRFTLGMR